MPSSLGREVGDGAEQGCLGWSADRRAAGAIVGIGAEPIGRDQQTEVDELDGLVAAAVEAFAGEAASTSITLRGLRSRWTIPAACAAARTPASCRAIRAARAGASGPSSSMTARNVRPSMYSSIEERRAVVELSPKSVAVAAFG